MKYVAKALEGIGIALAGIGLLYGFKGSMGKELTYALVGVLIFFLGWLVEKKLIRK